MENKNIFKGYKEIVTEFWGLDEEEVSNSVKQSKWWADESVYFIDTEDMDYEIKNLGKNETETNIVLEGKEFPVFDISGDGGFVGFLIKEKDFESLATKIPVIENEKDDNFDCSMGISF